MMTQTAVYALRALLHLAHEPEDDYHQTAHIAEKIRVPGNYLGKILQKLARARIVESQKGLHGGFRLARLPEQVRLLDVFRAIDNLSEATTTFSSSEQENDPELAKLQQRLGNFDRLYTRFLNDTTLADLLEVPDETYGSDPALKDAQAPGEVVLSI
jgi:Rrf2 family transcriptional regulator, nitric oxide-sensitive transcriptional repressor